MNAGTEKRVELKFHNIHNHGTDIAGMWMNEIDKRSEGRVRFTITEGDDQELINNADIVRDTPALDSRYSLLNLVQIPFIFPNSSTGSKVIAQLYTEFSELRSELNDNKVLGLGTGALMAVFSNHSKGPIRTLEDFRGTRIRSLSLMDRIFKVLGEVPVRVGWFDMYRLLDTREIDAAFLGVMPAFVFKLAEGPAPFCTITGKNSISMHPMRMYMKWDTWNRLPSDVKNIIDELGPFGAGCWYAVQNGSDSDNHLKEALEDIKKKGEIIEVSEEETQRCGKVIRTEVEAIIAGVESKGLPARRFYTRMLELVREYDTMTEE